MSVTKEKIEELTKDFGENENNSGATETQIAIFTERIRNITSHLKQNKKDQPKRSPQTDEKFKKKDHPPPNKRSPSPRKTAIPS